MARQGEIEGIDDHGVQEDRSVYIVHSGVQVVLSGEGIGGSHLHSQGDLPDNVKVLEEKVPAGLEMRELVRILEVGQVLVVGENRDRIQGSL